MALRRRLFTITAATTVAALATLPALAAAQVTAGQTDTFDDGTTQGWAVGVGPGGGVSPVPPENVADGGPGGDGDAYLQLESIGGNVAGGRLSVLNVGGQWAGDYLAAGITHVEMDVINLGTTDLFLRIMIADPGAGPPTNVAFSGTAISLPAGTGWTRVAFPLFGTNGLVAVEGTLDAALANATELRLFHSEAFAFPPAPVVATLGVDNITATASVVPEPGTFLLLGSGIFALFAIRGRARRR